VPTQSAQDDCRVNGMTDWRERNREFWDERVPIHVPSAFYDVEGFLAGASALRSFELAELGDVEGLDLVHPQCHFGLDTLSWARQGARVTGLDFSAPAIEAARDLARRAGLPAEFVHADVYDAAEALGDRRFDVVYTGLGAINWLPDVTRWALVMAALLRPGGKLYVVEFHPFADVFADEDLSVVHSYFHRGPWTWDEPGSYADPDAVTVHNRTVEWHHGLGEVVSAICAAGLGIDFLHERDHTLFQRWPFLQRAQDGTYVLPAGVPPLPLMYSLLARAAADPAAH
jgi:SAM-dependent methyltransferase